MPHSTRVFSTIPLDAPLAAAPDRTGAKAANLPQAATAAARCPAALHRGRTRGQDAPHIVAAEPAVPTLTPPALVPAPRLPASAPPTRAPGELPPREPPRLRTRWAQKLGARLAWTAGRRLTAAGAMARPGLVRALRFDELTAALQGGPLPAGLERRPSPPGTAPLPAVFRLAGERIVAEAAPSRDDARPAGGGRRPGPAHAGPGTPPSGSVLRVDALKPSPAAYLPSLAGVVAETGSPLSHLAILARDMDVPTVMGLRGALDRDGERGCVFAQCPTFPRRRAPQARCAERGSAGIREFGGRRVHSCGRAARRAVSARWAVTTPPSWCRPR
ncbi:PEP-utilizing enzyme [Actinomadura sp. NPDC047616]|uniref:PEP-utilizing enzyme n=1 Tax=Actinomadura sp. NPDC047616 TaxID=3155914 RepID=UPI0033C29DEF